jgi:hypothetical protein
MISQGSTIFIVASLLRLVKENAPTVTLREVFPQQLRRAARVVKLGIEQESSNLYCQGQAASVPRYYAANGASTEIWLPLNYAAWGSRHHLQCSGSSAWSQKSSIRGSVSDSVGVLPYVLYIYAYLKNYL